MADDGSAKVEEPFAIFKLANHYMLYDVHTISHIRANHNIPGVLTGLLPQAPQQNVFSGVPLELMPEEARLLCEKGVAYIVDDVRAHKQGFLDRGLGEEGKRMYKEQLRRQGVSAAKAVQVRMEDRKVAAVKKVVAKGGSVGDWNDLPEDMLRPASRAGGAKKKKGRRQADSGTVTPEVEGANGESTSGTAVVSTVSAKTAEEEDKSLFGSPMNSFPNKSLPLHSRNTSTASVRKDLEPYGITPATSYPPLTATPPPPRSRPTTPSAAQLSHHQPSAQESSDLPEVPNEASYQLYRHMHNQGYFLTPGLRFGCQYTAYPGDPLRFHSHFLCRGLGWDEEFELGDLVAGGRLGTGVKKGWLLGGAEEGKDGTNGTGERTRLRAHEDGGTGGHDCNVADREDGQKDEVRVFCVEWGGM
ncbi:tRNA-splicing endonuclease subunit [Elasticomyces elasticus]|nr:tRNA-splicing endonuclease subunit [Elasticomyces elasticus]KAK4931117.1 tRNA-splicing endonuclease subunit [Elasticomyces elasticus]